MKLIQAPSRRYQAKVRSRTIRALVSAMLAMVAGALGSHVFGQLDAEPRTLSWILVLLLVISLLLTLWSILLIEGGEPTPPGIYHVSLLFSGMIDQYHAIFGDCKVRYIPIGDKIHSADEIGVLDVASTVESLVSRTHVEWARDTSGDITLAPNMLWPMAMAFGADMQPPPGLILEESMLPKAKVATMRWYLTGDTATEAESSRLQVRERVTGSEASVLVVFNLTNQGTTALPRDWRYGRLVTIGAPVTGDKEPDSYQPVIVTVDPDVGSDPASASTVTPQEAVATVRTAIREILHEHPDSQILLVGRMPKTVAVAVGWSLSKAPRMDDPGCGHPGCRRLSCRDPWTRLVPLNWSPEGYQPVRTHRGQPPTAELTAALARTTTNPPRQDGAVRA